MESDEDNNFAEDLPHNNEELNLQLKSLVKNDLDFEDTNRLRDLVSIFIQKAEETITDILIKTSLGSKLPTTNLISALRLLFSNLLRSATSFLEDGLNHDNGVIRMKVKQMLLKEFKNDIPSTERIAKCLHMYWTYIATDIYLHFRFQINRWIRKQRTKTETRVRVRVTTGTGTGAGNRTGQASDVDELVEYIVKRYLRKLQKFQNISSNDVMRKFVGGQKKSCGCCCSPCCLSKRDSEFRKIFTKPIPDPFLLLGNKSPNISIVAAAGKEKKTNKQLKSAKLIRPPFQFEVEEFQIKQQNCKNLEKKEIAFSDKCAYEEPRPLAIQMFEERKIQNDTSQRQQKLCASILDVFPVQVRELESRLSQKLGMTDFVGKIEVSQSPQNFGSEMYSSNQIRANSPAQRIMKLSGEIENFVQSFKKFGNSGNLSVMKKCLEIIFDKIESQNKTAGIGTDALELFHMISFLATDLITVDVCTRFYYNNLLDKDPSREINSKPKKEKVKYFEKLLKILTKNNLISTSVDLPEVDADAEWSMNRKITVNSLIQKTTREIFHGKKATSSNLLKYFCSSLKCDNEIDNVLYNEHLTSIADCLLTTNNSPSDDISIAACIMTSKISTGEPVRVMQSLVNKIQSFYQEINIHKERKEEIRILEITLNLLQVNGSKVVCMNKVEDLIGSVVSSMGTYANNIYLQFVGCSTLKHLLCDHPMRSLISCYSVSAVSKHCGVSPVQRIEIIVSLMQLNQDVFSPGSNGLMLDLRHNAFLLTEIQKRAFRTSLECILSLLAQPVNAVLKEWILLFKNIFESFTTSENMFLAESPGDTVKLLLSKFTPDLDLHTDNSFWAGLYSAMYGSKNLPGVDSAKTVEEAENSFCQNNGISIITNKLDVLTKTYSKFPQQNRNIFGIIIRLASKYDFAEKLLNSTDFMICLRACISSFYNDETSDTQQQDNTGKNNDTRTVLKLGVISYAQLSVVIKNPPNSQIYSELQLSAAQKIAELEESDICLSCSCEFCAKHSRECVQSLLSVFMEILEEDHLSAAGREVKAAKFCIFMCKPLVQQQLYHSVELLNEALSKEAKPKSKYHTQKSRPVSMAPSMKYAKKVELRNAANATDKGEEGDNKAEKTGVVNWIGQFLNVSSNNLNLESLVLSLSEGNANLSQWKPQNLTYLVVITVCTILKQSSCDEANSHCGTDDTELRFAFKTLSSIQWSYYRHSMKMHPIHKFLIHLGLQYYSIFSQFHNTDNNPHHSSNQTAAFRRSRWNLIQWASKQMDKFCSDKYEENILAVRLGGLAIYKATQII